MGIPVAQYSLQLFLPSAPHDAEMFNQIMNIYLLYSAEHAYLYIDMFTILIHVK